MQAKMKDPIEIEYEVVNRENNNKKKKEQREKGKRNSEKNF